MERLTQWLAERKKGIGGSDAAAVLSEGYGCPRALFLDKTGVEPDYEHSPRTLGLFERGHELEAGIARKFAKESGLTVRRVPTMINADRPWMRVNVDRMIKPITDPDAVEARYRDFADMGPGYLEAKSANEHVFANMRFEGMPNHYVIQGQHGLAVSGWQWGAFAVREPYTFEFMHFPFKRNEQLIDVLLEIEEAFCKAVIAGDIPNKLEDFNDSRCEACGYRLGCRNAEALPAKKYRKPVYAPDNSEQLFEIVGQIKSLDAQIEQAQAMRSAALDELRAEMGERTHVLVPGQGKKITRFWQNGALRYDTKALDAERPELAERYKRRGEPFEQVRLYDVAELPESVKEALREVA